MTNIMSSCLLGQTYIFVYFAVTNRSLLELLDLVGWFAFKLAKGEVTASNHDVVIPHILSI